MLTTTPDTDNAIDALRFVTAGSVDDGKSTLIGRLLYDAKSVFEDQIAQVQDASVRRGDARTNLALLTDGLRAEREQGITIDVAYRYFATPRRRFVIADTPGHVQYTRNMVTGASQAELAVVLVDARHGVGEQTRRHTFLAGLLGIDTVVFAVNKMDLVDYDQARFEAIQTQLALLGERAGIAQTRCVPLSALVGDNVVTRSQAMPWYQGRPLLSLLEEIDVRPTRPDAPARFAVQWVIRPQSETHPDYRGFSGRVEGGPLAVGDRVVAMASGLSTRIVAIDTHDGPLRVAPPGRSVTLRLANDIDISRGDLLAPADAAPVATRSLRAAVAWLGDQPLDPSRTYALKHTTRWCRAKVASFDGLLDLDSGTRRPPVGALEKNAIGELHLKTSQPVFADAYADQRSTGAFILVDEQSHQTVGAGVIEDPQA